MLTVNDLCQEEELLFLSFGPLQYKAGFYPDHRQHWKEVPTNIQQGSGILNMLSGMQQTHKLRNGTG